MSWQAPIKFIVFDVLQNLAAGMVIVTATIEKDTAKIDISYWQRITKPDQTIKISNA